MLGVIDLLTTSALLLALAALALGLVVGSLLTRTLHPHERERRELEEKLEKSQDQLKNYQHEVTEHFVQTSELINNLTQSYRDVHEHLATSAMRLTSPEVSRQLIEAGYGKLGASDHSIPATLSAELPDPPKDYAPKVPGGVLSEEYGLRDELTQPDTSHPAVANDGYADDDDEDATLKVI